VVGAMLAFFDEAGDASMSGKPGQTPHFVVALVLFEDHDQAEKADARMDLLRTELGLRPNTEFRFHSATPTVRRYVLEQLLAYQWFYQGVVIHKRRLWSPTFTLPKMFYNYSTSLVFENAKPHLRDAIVIIDASGGLSFRHALSRYLRQKIDPKGGLIRKIKHQNSAANNLIQLADLVAGSIYRSMRADKKDRWAYRQLIRARELRVQVWPGGQAK
jgi:hypothetical protein